MEVKCRGRTTFVFFKLSGDLIDEEIGPQSGYLKTAGIDIHRYDQNLRDISKISDELRRICQQFHPQLELLQENLIL